MTISTSDSDVPNLLYHYTDSPGLLGIVSSNRLWATNARYLNDASEFVYAQRIFADVGQAYLDTVKSPAVRDGLGLVIQMSRFSSGSQRMYDLHVACFCDHGDLLSQWRGYGNRGGFAIGFRTAELLDRCNPAKPGWRYTLCKMVYDRHVQEQLVTSLLGQTCEALARASRRDRGSTFAELVALPELSNLQVRILGMLATFKNPGFAEEREWRIVQALPRFMVSDADRSLMQFRDKGGLIVPYVDLDLSSEEGGMPGRLPIAKVVCGPTHSPDSLRFSVGDLLAKYGWPVGTTEVTSSRVPLA
ncbi:MAG: DUF2971 domain-containing protein [Candidatus Dormibacteria bacterium]